jgi:hypothetical protein
MDTYLELIAAIKDRDPERARALAREQPEAAVWRDEEGLLPAVLALYGDVRLAATLLPPMKLTIFEAALFGREDRLRLLLEAEPGLVGA